MPDEKKLKSPTKAYAKGKADSHEDNRGGFPVSPNNSSPSRDTPLVKTNPLVGRPTSYEDWMPQTIVDVMSEGGSITEVASELKISKQTLYDWINKKSPRFNKEFSDAIAIGKVECQKWWEKAGRSGVFAKQFSAAVWQFNMKNRFKDDWSDTIKNEHSVAKQDDFIQELASEDQPPAKLVGEGEGEED